MLKSNQYKNKLIYYGKIITIDFKFKDNPDVILREFKKLRSEFSNKYGKYLIYETFAVSIGYKVVDGDIRLCLCIKVVGIHPDCYRLSKYINKKFFIDNNKLRNKFLNDVKILICLNK